MTFHLWLLMPNLIDLGPFNPDLYLWCLLFKIDLRPLTFDLKLLTVTSISDPRPLTLNLLFSLQNPSLRTLADHFRAVMNFILYWEHFWIRIKKKNPGKSRNIDNKSWSDNFIFQMWSLNLFYLMDKLHYHTSIINSE